jgi:hypothetical protein
MSRFFLFCLLRRPAKVIEEFEERLLLMFSVLFCFRRESDLQPAA